MYSSLIIFKIRGFIYNVIYKLSLTRNISNKINILIDLNHKHLSKFRVDLSLAVKY